MASPRAHTAAGAALALYGALLVHSVPLATAVAGAFAVLFARSLEARLAIWLFVRLAAFSGYMPPKAAMVTLALLMLTTVIRQLTGHRRVNAPPGLRLWLVLLAIVGVNLLLHGPASESVAYALQVFVESFLVLLMLSNSPPRWGRERGAVGVLAGLTAFVGGFSLLELVIGHPLLLSLSSARTAYLPTAQSSTFAGTQRLGSLLFNADWMAVILVFGLAIWGAKAVWARGMQRVTATAFAVLILILGLATLTRSIFIGAPLAALTIFLMARSRKKWALVAQAALVLVAVANVAPGVLHAATSRLEDPAELQLRVGAFETAARALASRPLTGLGMGWERYSQEAEPYRDGSSQYIRLAHPHNSYLEIGAMLGLPGLAAFGGLLALGLARALRYRKAAPSAAAFAGMVVFLAMSTTVNGMTLPFLGTLFWVTWWVVVGAAPPPVEARRRRPRPERARRDALSHPVAALVMESSPGGPEREGRGHAALSTGRTGSSR